MTVSYTHLDVYKRQGFVSMMGQTAYIDNMEYQLSDGTYKAADITARDSDGNVTEDVYKRQYL